MLQAFDAPVRVEEDHAVREHEARQQHARRVLGSHRDIDNDAARLLPRTACREGVAAHHVAASGDLRERFDDDDIARAEPGGRPIGRSLAEGLLERGADGGRRPDVEEALRHGCVANAAATSGVKSSLL